MNDIRKLKATGTAMIAGCVLLIALAVGFLAKTHEPPLRPGDLRAEGKPLTGSTMILLDQTDPYTPSQVHGLLQRLDALERDELRPNELVEAWAIGDYKEGNLRELFHKCFPGIKANPIVNTPSMIAARCESLFFRPLAMAVIRAAEGDSAARSAIFESVHELAGTADFTDVTKPRRLVLASDLIEHADSLSFYHAVPDLTTFLGSSFFQEMQANLQGVDVVVLYLTRRRDAVVSGDAVRRLWAEYFHACGAKSVRFERL